MQADTARPGLKKQPTVREKIADGTHAIVEAPAAIARAVVRQISGRKTKVAADAAAKAHLGTVREDTMMDLCERITTRPMLYTLASDFGADGTLQPVGARAAGKQVLWDRRLFPGVRRRVARHVHTRLHEGLHGAYVDAALIGRRWHPSEARTFAEVAKSSCSRLRRWTRKMRTPSAGWRQTHSACIWPRSHASMTRPGFAARRTRGLRQRTSASRRRRRPARPRG